MLEDIGGVKEILISIFGIVFYSAGTQSYNLKFIKELFLLRQPPADTNAESVASSMKGE